MLDYTAYKNNVMAELFVLKQILRSWDPMGAHPRATSPTDVYDSHASHILSMIRRGCSSGDLTTYLERLGAERADLKEGQVHGQARSYAEHILNAVPLSNISLQRDRGG